VRGGVVGTAVRGVVGTAVRGVVGTGVRGVGTTGVCGTAVGLPVVTSTTRALPIALTPEASVAVAVLLIVAPA
jgi:hypothetical protein